MHPKDIPAPLVAEADQMFADANKELNDVIAGMRAGLIAHPEMAHSHSLLWYHSAADYRMKMTQLRSLESYVATSNYIADLFTAAVFRLIAQETPNPLGDKP